MRNKKMGKYSAYMISQTAHSGSKTLNQTQSCLTSILDIINELPTILIRLDEI